jgi:hypothetical protein
MVLPHSLLQRSDRILMAHWTSDDLPHTRDAFEDFAPAKC